MARIEKITGISRSLFNRASRHFDILHETFAVLARHSQVNNGGEFGLGKVRVGLNDQPLVFHPLDVPKSSQINLSHLPEFLIDRLLPSRRKLHASFPDDDGMTPHSP